MSILPVNARVMLIDDEPANNKLLTKILNREGCANILALSDSRLAIERFLDWRPHLILLDINMPYMDGFDVMTGLHGLNEALLPPIVVLTARDSSQTLLAALAAGATDFIRKPFDREELVMRLRNLLFTHLGHRGLHEQNSLLYQTIQDSHELLKTTQLEVLRHLGKAAVCRDNETGLHTLRMARMSALLAKEHGWSDSRCDDMLYASPMHDIGKIGIPDAVLLKPGKFTSVEWDIMKMHAEIGAMILTGGQSDVLDLARTIALSHHERWDGTGYPQGLRGEEIPMAARIVSIADVFDALTSARPYKSSWSAEEAINYICDGAGKQFDPALVASFRRCLPQILEVVDMYKETGLSASATTAMSDATAAR